jgi:hypothetical protein
MRTEKRLISVQSMILVFCPLLLLTSNAHTQTRRKIEGLVSDKDNIKIPAVLVRVYRGKEKLGEVPIQSPSTTRTILPPSGTIIQTGTRQ